MNERSTIFLIARQEVMVLARNRWTIVIAASFAVLVIAIAMVGTLAEGFEGIQSFRRTSTSLLNLVVTFIPLLALIVGTISFTGDRGSAELLFSQPISRTAVLLGKALGVVVSLWGSMFVGFLGAGAMIVIGNGIEGAVPFISLVLLSMVLGGVFVGISVFSAMITHRTTKAFGLALGLWFLFVLLYDLVIIGVVASLKGPTATTLLFLSLFGNPVDMVRVSALLSMENASIFGASGAALLRFLGGTWSSAIALAVGLIAWLIVPMFISLRLIRRQDL